MKREDLASQLEQARPHVDAGWSEERARRVEAAMARRGQARARARRGAAVALVPMVALLAWGLWPAPARARVEPLTPGTVVQPQEAGAVLVTGAAWFEVRVDPTHPWTVSAGDVEVQVLGTRFLVERLEGQVHVSVAHGRVHVRWPGGGEALLTDGQSGRFPPPLVAPVRPEEANPAAEAPLSPPPPPRAPPRNVRPAQPAWQDLAREGDFDGAWGRLHQPAASPRDVPEELLLAADVARLSHHSEAAVEPLQRCIDRHAADPRAPLAAFTLGRVLLDELGRPRQAAEAFRRAHELSPQGPLAEDALAREVESWARAGEPGPARTAAQLYLQRYPGGRREASVRRHGELP
jgi:transmembrane sensor